MPWASTLSSDAFLKKIRQLGLGDGIDEGAEGAGNPW